MQLYQFLEGICVNNIKKLAVNFLLGLERKFGVPVDEEGAGNGAILARAFYAFEGQSSRKKVNHGVEIVATCLYDVSAVGVIELLVKFFCQSLQILHRLLFVYFVEEFGKFAVVLIKTDNGFVYQHQLRVLLGQLFLEASEF